VSIFTPSKQMAADLVRHEGLRLDVYADSEGFATQGIGRHSGVYFGDAPIDELTAYRWLAEDLQKAYSGALNLLPDLGAMDLVRKEACIELAYNMGEGTLGQFVPFLTHLKAGEWAEAAFHLLTNTKRHLTPYLTETGARAVETALRIATGTVLEEFKA
jgi:GH24 family phage-related lysozyme (muramidase)